MIIYHHNDNDGRCAAWMIARRCKRDAVRLVECDYRAVPDLGLIEPNEIVCILDYSFKPLDMEGILRRTQRVVWIDHHKSAIEELQAGDFDDPFHGWRDVEKSATWLTWNYLEKAWGNCPEWPINRPVLSGIARETAAVDRPPYVVVLVDDYDTWRHMYPESRLFNLGSQIQDTAPRAGFWERCLLEVGAVHAVVTNGAAIASYEKARNARSLAEYGYWAILSMKESPWGVLCLEGVRGIDAFGEYALKRLPLLAAYRHDGQRFHVSLYSSMVDVSKIAQQYGGGGHKGAAGFSCERLPWKWVRKALPEDVAPVEEPGEAVDASKAAKACLDADVGAIALGLAQHLDMLAKPGEAVQP
ncbi:MAG: hypothetical protein PHR35_08560 [Kiritimatiellae bacterium]|nr:hypothetical protein [Kiritimatiellia bacterium]